MQPTQQRLKELLDYCPENGVFTWKVYRGGFAKQGTVAGKLHHEGYVHIRVDRRMYQAHRLAFIWMTGAAPRTVDHINRDRSDNRWANLRAASYELNSLNRKAKGYFKGANGKFCARLKQEIVGIFDTAEEARAAHLEAKRKAIQECTQQQANRGHHP